MTEAVPADSLCDSHQFERRPNVTFENHVRRQRLRSVLRDGRKDKVVIGPVEGGLCARAQTCRIHGFRSGHSLCISVRTGIDTEQLSRAAPRRPSFVNEGVGDYG